MPTQYVSIFEGEGRTPEFLALNPTGRVPAIRLADGRALAESNAILAFLADGTRYLPAMRTRARRCTSGCRSSRKTWSRRSARCATGR
jgi:glutathione S-transferase